MDRCRGLRRLRAASDGLRNDPEVSGEIIRRFKQASPAVDYASNTIPNSYPLGLDTEAFTFEALERAWRQATEPYEHTHVTIYIHERPAIFRLLSIVSDVDRADWRWTLDTREDLEFIRQVYHRLGAAGDFTWRDVLALLEREPSLREINRHVRQKTAREG